MYVSDQPVVSITLGSDVDPNSLREGDDVRLTCEVKSNPEYERITWYHGVSLAGYIHNVNLVSSVVTINTVK